MEKVNTSVYCSIKKAPEFGYCVIVEICKSVCSNLIKISCFDPLLLLKRSKNGYHQQRAQVYGSYYA